MRRKSSGRPTFPATSGTASAWSASTTCGPEATEGVREQFGVETVFGELDELLSDPEIEIVDVATHPDVRPALVRQALAAGKHVLAQKPLAADLQTARELVEEGERLGLLVAVNQNGRWAPAWRAATLLIEQGAIGDVVAVSHLYHHNYDFTIGTVFDEIEHLVLYDYSVHWFDISRCWLEGKTVTHGSGARVPNAEPAAPRARRRGAPGRRSTTRTARAR